ncbi:MAG: hypothetical protein ABIK68_03070 [bacterium]
MAGNKKRNTCLIVGLVLVGLCLCSLVILGGGGYYLYSNGQLSYNQVLNWFNLGPAEIQIANLTDGVLSAEMTWTDPDTGETSHWGSKELASFDISSFRDLAAGKYQLTLSTSNGIPFGGTCRMNLKGGDLIEFIAVPEGIGVILSGGNVTAPEEVNMLTSPLCQD